MIHWPSIDKSFLFHSISVSATAAMKRTSKVQILIRLCYLQLLSVTKSKFEQATLHHYFFNDVLRQPHPSTLCEILLLPSDIAGQGINARTMLIIWNINLYVCAPRCIRKLKGPILMWLTIFWVTQATLSHEVSSRFCVSQPISYVIQIIDMGARVRMKRQGCIS